MSTFKLFSYPGELITEFAGSPLKWVNGKEDLLVVKTTCSKVQKAGDRDVHLGEEWMGG